MDLTEMGDSLLLQTWHRAPLKRCTSTSPLASSRANLCRAYTGLLQQLQRLADSSLAALRCELRIKVLYNLSFMSREVRATLWLGRAKLTCSAIIRQNILVLHENPSGTDRFVAELNSQLAESDESLGATLASHERK